MPASPETITACEEDHRGRRTHRLHVGALGAAQVSRPPGGLLVPALARVEQSRTEEPRGTTEWGTRIEARWRNGLGREVWVLGCDRDGPIDPDHVRHRVGDAAAVRSALQGRVLQLSLPGHRGALSSGLPLA